MINQDMSNGGKEDLSTNKILNNEIALIIIDGQSRFAKFDDKNNFEIWTKQAIEEWYASYFGLDENGEPITYKTSGNQKPAFNCWTVWDKKNKYSGLIFDPSKPKAYKDKLNLWNDFAFEPKESDCQLILDHILKIWCKGHLATYKYVLNWLARMIQQPEKRAETALILKSGQGTGKGIIIDMIIDLFFNNSSVCTKQSDITGDFNDHLSTSVLVVFNEAIWSGNKGAEGFVKALITDPTITMHKKFMPKIKVKNCTHLIVTTNNDYSMALDLDDRRMVNLVLSEDKKDDTNYFIPLKKQIDNGGKEAFIYHLKNMDIKNFNPRVKPKLSDEIKAERGNLKLLNADPVTKWAVDFIENEGYQLKEFDNEKWLNNSIQVPRQYLFNNYVEYCKNAKLYQGTNTAFNKKLKDLFNLTESRPKIENYRLRCFNFEPLDQCKKRMKEKFNGDLSFDDCD